jgi:hypothetical protein
MVIPLRIFQILEQPTEPINEIRSYEILDGIVANSVNLQVPFFYFLIITNLLSISPSYSYNDLNDLPSCKLLTLICLRINWIEAIPSSLAGIGISTRSGSQSVSTKQIVRIHLKFCIPQEQWILLVD